MTQLDMKSLKKAMNDLGEIYVKELTKQLISADKKATGDLIKSVRYDAVEAAGSILLNISALDYLTYVDEGRRKGSFPPIKPIEKWVKVKNIRFNNYTQKQTAWVIANSIKKEGIKPSHVIQKTIDAIDRTKSRLLARAAREDVLIAIDKMIVDINGK